MQPRDLTGAMFDSYPALGRRVAVEHLALLRDLPLVLDAVLLREVQEYDASFPAERQSMDARFTYLASLSADARHEMTRGFASLALSEELLHMDWVRAPRRFEEALSAHLWASHQMDTFRTVSEEFVRAVSNATPAQALPMRRLAVMVLPAELHRDGYPMFRKLMPQGTLFSRVEGGDGMEAVLARLAQRAAKAPAPYDHWYIDGGQAARVSGAQIGSFSWDDTEPLREAVLNKVQSVIGSGSAGPEMLRSIMADWHPTRMQGHEDPLIGAFVQRVYGEGAGTQIFSTTFVQWSARELLKRAQPVTLVARFGVRQRQRSMNEMFSAAATEMDYSGSALDADFASYYTWINLQRLSGAERASFVAWSQHEGSAIAIGPGFPRGTESPGAITMEKLLGLIEET
jgi:hypothetical protein